MMKKKKKLQIENSKPKNCIIVAAVACFAMNIPELFYQNLILLGFDVGVAKRKYGVECSQNMFFEKKEKNARCLEVIKSF